MLYPTKDKSRIITEVTRRDNALFLVSEHGKHRIVPKSDRTIRISYTDREDFSARMKLGVIAEDTFADWSVEEKDDVILLKLPKLQVEINKETGSYTYYDGMGRLLLEETKKESKETK